MIVEVKVVGQPRAVIDRDYEGFLGPTTLRALLSDLVSRELDGYEERRAAGQVLSVLTPQALAAGLDAGRITSGGRTTPPAPSVEEATARALEAFSDGLYFVLLDGKQIEDLDAELLLAPTSRLRLVRLVALAGG